MFLSNAYFDAAAPFKFNPIEGFNKTLTFVNALKSLKSSFIIRHNMKCDFIIN